MPPVNDEEPRSGLNCNCWATTIRILNQSKAPFRSTSLLSDSSPSALDQQPLSLSAVLIIGRNLVDNWELINSCPKSESHLRPPCLPFMVDAISRTLGIYEVAVNELGNGIGRSFREYDAPATFLGGLELADEEAVIVARETLRYSVMRLGAMLQDIEEESRRCGSEMVEYGGQFLEEKDVKGLATRLFRLLGRINGMNPAL